MKKFACYLMSVACLLSGPAIAGQGLGDAYATKYESLGIIDRMSSQYDEVVIDVEDIETINCGGCDYVWYGPGSIFHMRNVTRQPICASLDFTPVDDRSWFVHRWGSGVAHYLKPGQTLKKIGGLYTISTGETGSVDLGYSWEIRTWEPVAKNDCG